MPVPWVLGPEGGESGTVRTQRSNPSEAPCPVLSAQRKKPGLSSTLRVPTVWGTVRGRGGVGGENCGNPDWVAWASQRLPSLGSFRWDKGRVLFFGNRSGSGVVPVVLRGLPAKTLPAPEPPVSSRFPRDRSPPGPSRVQPPPSRTPAHRLCCRPRRSGPFGVGSWLPPAETPTSRLHRCHCGTSSLWTKVAVGVGP